MITRIQRFMIAVVPIIIGLSSILKGEVTFYVSPDGNDTAGGRSPNDAFATLTRARDAVRELKQSGGFTAPVTVVLRGGTYRLAEPLLFVPDDSGTETHSVTWTAYPEETPMVSGALRLTGWKEMENGLWTVSLSEVASGDWYFTTLFVDGESRPRTRLPREGYYRIVDYPSKDRDPWAAPGNHFVFSPGDIQARWKNLSDVEIVVLRFWVSSRQHIASVNEKSNTVYFNEQTHYRYSDDFSTDGARYYVENVFEALDEPGEWYLNRPEGKLYYFPRAEENLEKTVFEAPVSPQLIRVEGDPSQRAFVTNIRFQGITFTQNNWMLPEGNPGDGQSAPEVEGALYFRGAIGCAVDHCNLVQLSSYGIQIDEGCRKNRFAGNEMGHLGGGGIRMGGGDAYSYPDLRTGENLIADNHIHHIGEIYHAATGIWIQHSGGNTITHNEIDHTYYSSLAIGWVWGYRPSVTTHNEISYNHIHHVGQGVLSDMGGIYMLGVAPGTIVRNNLIHDIESYGYGGWGIYADEGSSHLLIENNIVYNTKCAGFDQHYGRENIVRNNIFALGDEDQIHRSRVEEHISFYLERNILYCTEDTPFIGGTWEKKTYMHRPGKPWIAPEPDSITHVFDHNLYYNPDKKQDEIRFDQWSFKEWQANGQDIHSLYADPLFVDPENGDFNLRQNSPAFILGFRPIDMQSVGPRLQAGDP